MGLACPDCGANLVIQSLADGTHTCRCPADCRADFVAHGKLPDMAADRFVQKCERYGYMTALEQKLSDALQWK